MPPLSPKQALFVQEYLVDKNATRAAKAAGYSVKTAEKIGSENLHKPEVKAAIDAGIAEQVKKIEKRAEKKLITKERLLERLGQIAFANFRDFVSVSDRGTVKLIPTSSRSRQKDYAIKKISQSSSQFGGSDALELHDPMKAAELIAKMCGWITDKHEHTGKDGAPLSVTVEIVHGSKSPSSSK